MMKYQVGDIIVYKEIVPTVITAEEEGCLLHDSLYKDTHFYKFQEIEFIASIKGYIHYPVVKV